MNQAHSRMLKKFVVGLVGMALIGAVMNISSNWDTADHIRMLSTFERAKIANHDLNESVLRLKTFVLHSYDPLVRDLTVMDKGCKQMKSDRDFDILRSPEVRGALENYCLEVETKAILVERYKSEHSVLRNSLSYLPHLVSQLERSKYAHSSHALLANLLLYGFELDLADTGNIERDIEAFNPSAASKKEKELLQSLQLHARTVLKHWQKCQEVEQRTLSPKLAKSLEQLESGYIAHYQVRQARALVLHYLLAVSCLGLMGWLMFVFRRLNDTTDSLQDLNKNLEQKVNARTQELSAALTQLKNNQQVLAQSAKMTALGEMAGGIAHEINTPLAAITMNAGMILDSLETEGADANRKRIESILKIVERVSKIVMGLRRFARSGESAVRAPVSVQTIVEDTLSLCSEKLKSHSVDLQLKVDESLVLECVPEQISQVLLNFLNNSLDALKENVPVEQRWIRLTAERRDAQIEISVVDAGGGLPESVQAKLMQPFFTTKPPGMGTGLGLSISRSIVEEHGGKLLYDRESTNTRFVMRFGRAA